MEVVTSIRRPTRGKRLLALAAMVSMLSLAAPAPSSAHTACEPSMSSDPLQYVVNVALCVPENQVHSIVDHQVPDLIGDVLCPVEVVLWVVTDCVNGSCSSPPPCFG